MVTGSVVQMRDIHKEFPHVKAVDGGRIDILTGEIHALIGENGAGKSTLMRLLYGMYPLDRGTINVKGSVFSAPGYGTREALRMGIGMVHQEFMLVNELTVLENIILGFEPTLRGGRLDFPRAEESIGRYIEDYGLDVPLGRTVKNISVGTAQRVEIIKTLYRGAELLILDEPTAVLTPQETEQLFSILRTMRDGGKTIVFISHKLGEIMEIGDRVTVMRAGRHIATLNKKDTNPAELANLMVGREIPNDKPRVRAASSETVFSAEHLYVASDRELSTLRDVSFAIRKGEVLGVAGVDGNGQSELIEALTGLRKIQGGTVRLFGRNIAGEKAGTIRAAGLGHIPEDRNVRGLNKDFTVAENLLAARIDEPCFGGWGILRNEAILGYAKNLIETFDIRPATPGVRVAALSGGNAQKIVVAREIDAEKGFLIACQPTRGVDVGAIQSIRDILNQAKVRGVSILLVSTDLDEILAMSDRIVTLYKGRITGELINENVDIERLGLLMMGGAQS
jgi:simple sugar transport system ATP-binding protein